MNGGASTNNNSDNNNNNNAGYGISSGMEMDVDSPPKQSKIFVVIGNTNKIYQVGILVTFLSLSIVFCYILVLERV